MKPPYAIGLVPSLSGHAIAYRWRSLPKVRRHRASKPQGRSKRVLPWQVTMDQLICASLSHTHYWYEMGMLKIPNSRPNGDGVSNQLQNTTRVLRGQQTYESIFRTNQRNPGRSVQFSDKFNDWGGRGYDDFVPGEVTKKAPSGDETT